MALADYLDRPARPRVRLDDIYDLLPHDEQQEIAEWCVSEGGMAASQMAIALTNAAKKAGRPDLRISASSILNMRANEWKPL